MAQGIDAKAASYLGCFALLILGMVGTVFWFVGAWLVGTGWAGLFAFIVLLIVLFVIYQYGE